MDISMDLSMDISMDISMFRPTEHFETTALSYNSLEITARACSGPLCAQNDCSSILGHLGARDDCSSMLRGYLDTQNKTTARACFGAAWALEITARACFEPTWALKWLLEHASEPPGHSKSLLQHAAELPRRSKWLLDLALKALCAREHCSSGLRSTLCSKQLLEPLSLECSAGTLIYSGTVNKHVLKRGTVIE